MFDPVPQAVHSKLWKHQSEVLNRVVAHLRKSTAPFLIRMPTGTGKTGVIACLTRIANSGSSLVLAPWANLRLQMLRDLDRNFWNERQITPKGHEVVEIFPSTAEDLVRPKTPQVLVATLTTLNDIRRERPRVYEALSKAISLVIVDEGHYEPAVEWGKSVKGLNVRTVLLTATPYRNDLKLFRIDPKRSAFHFTHKEAVAQGIIRSLTFDTLSADASITSLARSFGAAWNEAKTKSRLPSREPRAIVCCEGHLDIQDTVRELRRLGINAIGVHEQFGDGPVFTREVPNPKDASAKADVWVHQNKLTEGLDDHRFCCIAFFSRIRNDRKLIQQIGRALRRDNGDRSIPALILAPPEFLPVETWDAYLEFETNLALLEPEHFRSVVRALLNSQPGVEYFEGRFRKRFEPDALQKNPQVIVSPSVLVRAKSDSFSLDDYVEDCTDTLNTEDAVILGADINGPCQKSATHALWVYASVRNARLLQRTSLYELRLETHCVVVADDHVLLSDSRGLLPTEYLEDHTRLVARGDLARWIDKTFRLTEIATDSSIPYDTVARGGNVRGHDLSRIPASLIDRLHICRSARGNSTGDRRYVGMTHGRLRKDAAESQRRMFDVQTFVDWAGTVAKTLSSKVQASPLFDRYMPITAAPVNPVPKVIALDLLKLNTSVTLADGTPCRLKSSVSGVAIESKTGRNVYTCAFELDGKRLENSKISLRIDYHASKQRFWFTKAKGATVRIDIRGDPVPRTLAEFMNQNQDIVLIGLEGGEIVYQGRNFFRIDYSFAKRELMNLIERPKGSRAYATEKGTKAQIVALRKSGATEFPPDSLFHAIASGSLKLPGSDGALICADLGTECADFLAADFNKKQLALIHAKVGVGRQVSASEFHEVIAQAMKNFAYFTRNADRPKGAKSWRVDAKWNKTQIPRLITSNGVVGQGEALWQQIKSEILESSSPDLYAILITAGCGDVDAMKAAVDTPSKRDAELGQFFHLLDGMNSYARQLGVKVLIYDLPYRPHAGKARKVRNPRKRVP